MKAEIIPRLLAIVVLALWAGCGGGNPPVLRPVTAPPSDSAGPVEHDVALELRPGDVLRYRTTVDLSIAISSEGQATVRGEAQQRYVDVVEVGLDLGNGVIELRERLEGFELGGDALLTGPMEAMRALLADVVLSSRIDRHGRVLSSSVGGEADHPAAGIMRQMSLATNLEALPGKSVRVGDSWTVAEDLPPMSGATGKAVFHFTLDRIDVCNEARCAIITGAIDFPDSAGAGAGGLDGDRSAGHTEIAFSLDRGVPVRASGSQTLVMSGQRDGKPVEMVYRIRFSSRLDDGARQASSLPAGGVQPGRTSWPR